MTAPTTGELISLITSCISLTVSVIALIIAVAPSKDYKKAMKMIKKTGKKK